MISERIAPGMLPRVLNSFDMTVIFVAIVLFIVNASALQPAGQSAFTFWILGFLVFLIPGALVTAQLGQMFPQEGSFFFSSRRRHTRLTCDWSSDVCSSDLLQGGRRARDRRRQGDHRLQRRERDLRA